MAQLDTLKIILGISGSDEDALLTIELELALDFIANRRDSYDNTDPEDPIPFVEKKYLNTQLMLASESYSKRGAEGEVDHSEAGVKRVYATGGLYSLATMNMVIPVIRVVPSEDVESE